jgi:dTDP-L-rhamnose 4-epimerase
VVFEDGNQTRDFVHVSDIAAGVAASLEPDAAVDRALNLGTGEAVSVLDVAHALARGLGVDVEPEIRGEYRAGDIRHCFSDISLARAELGYAPRVTFEDGTRELVGWLAEQEAEDRVDDATAALKERGLAR